MPASIDKEIIDFGRRAAMMVRMLDVRATIQSSRSHSSKLFTFSSTSSSLFEE